MADVARAIADLRRRRTPGTIGFYALLAAVALLLASVPVCRPVQDRLAENHQLRPSSLASWAVFQLTPKMYSFAHQTSFGVDRVVVETFWVNHYPIRAARFESGRAEIAASRDEIEVRVQTRYRGRSWVARFVVRGEPGGGLVLERIDGAP